MSNVGLPTFQIVGRNLITSEDRHLENNSLLTPFILFSKANYELLYVVCKLTAVVLIQLQIYRRAVGGYLS